MTMKTKFMMEGSTVSVINLNSETALDNLPPKIYTINHSAISGFYLTVTKDQLELPKKIYGNTNKRVEQCIHTYTDRSSSTGILLTGDKGTGKTLLMSLLSNAVINDLQMPVILIRDAYTGDQFTSFIETLGECCLVLDEFGKMYSTSHQDDRPSQDNLLSLLDGVDKTKRMVIMTENSELDINEFLLNRPSRIYYHFRYSKLDEASIRGYCEDHDVPQNVVSDMVDISRRSRIFSFDMLQSIVEEYTRFRIPIEDVIADLNIDIRQEVGIDIEILSVVRRSTEAKCSLFGSAIVSKPVGTHEYTYIKIKSDQSSAPTPACAEDCDADEDNYKEVYLELDHLVYESAGKMVFETKEYTITAKEVPQKNIDYFKMF